MPRVSTRLKHAWNAFSTPDPGKQIGAMGGEIGSGYIGGGRPGRTGVRIGNNRDLRASVYTRMAIDVASVDIRHVRTDNEGRYLEDIDSGLNECLVVEANIDQAAEEFRHDIVMTMFEQGVVAIVPVDTTIDPTVSSGFDVKTLRVGEIVSWHPEHVRVNVYNEKRGIREQIAVPKRMVAIVMNPFYSVMNEPSGTLQRLTRKLALLDASDEKFASDKLDVIIQLPFVVKTEARRNAANQRLKDLEFQMSNSQYGVAYADAAEKITQLNRPAENSLLPQIERLTDQLYVQLGVTPEVMNGTADEKTMLNYRARTVKPIMTAIVEAMRRSFLTKTARSQKQSIMYFQDPFELVPISGEGGLADIADKLGRNEVVASNEVRQWLGLKPSKDAKADQLINSNMPQPGNQDNAPPDENDDSSNDPLRKGQSK